MTELKPAEIKALWSHFDRNKDGQISREEFSQLIALNLKKQLGIDTQIPAGLLDEAFNLLDTSRGGTIDVEEFRENINKYWTTKETLVLKYFHKVGNSWVPIGSQQPPKGDSQELSKLKAELADCLTKIRSLEEENKTLRERNLDASTQSDILSRLTSELNETKGLLAEARAAGVSLESSREIQLIKSSAARFEQLAAEAEARESTLKERLVQYQGLERELKSVKAELDIEKDRLVRYKALVADKWRTEERKILNLVSRRENQAVPDEMSTVQAARASCEKMLFDIDRMFEAKNFGAESVVHATSNHVPVTPVLSARRVPSTPKPQRSASQVSRSKTPPPSVRECFLDITRPSRSPPRGRRAEDLFTEALVRRFGSLSAAFNAIDINKSGFVSLVELEWAAEQAKSKRAHATAFFFARKQAVPGRLTFDEFCS